MKMIMRTVHPSCRCWTGSKTKSSLIEHWQVYSSNYDTDLVKSKSWSELEAGTVIRTIRIRRDDYLKMKNIMEKKEEYDENTAPAFKVDFGEDAKSGSKLEADICIFHDLVFGGVIYNEVEDDLVGMFTSDEEECENREDKILGEHYFMNGGCSSYYPTEYTLIIELKPED